MSKPDPKLIVTSRSVWQYAVAAVLLLGWTVYLATSLPARHTARHWDLLWVGYDVALLAALGLTILWVRRRSPYAVMGLTAFGALLLADAWIDITSAHNGHQLAISIAMAVAVEVPVAIVALSRAARLLRTVANERAV